MFDTAASLPCPRPLQPRVCRKRRLSASQHLHLMHGRHNVRHPAILAHHPDDRLPCLIERNLDPGPPHPIQQHEVWQFHALDRQTRLRQDSSSCLNPSLCQHPPVGPLMTLRLQGVVANLAHTTAVRQPSGAPPQQALQIVSQAGREDAVEERSSPHRVHRCRDLRQAGGVPCLSPHCHGLSPARHRLPFISHHGRHRLTP